MAPLLPGDVDLEAILDRQDCVRHILGQLVFPRSEAELVATLDEYTSSGMDTRLPSGKAHCSVCDVREILDALEDANFVHAITGKKSWRALAEHADGLASTLTHTFPIEDGGHHNRILDWADDLEDPKRPGGAVPYTDEPRYAMTHAGHLALTGHAQGERPENDPEPPADPSSVQPAQIGAAS